MKQINPHSYSLKLTVIGFAVLSAVCWTSCSFNGVFLRPDKLPRNMGTITIIRKFSNDTILLSIGPGFQPAFTDKAGSVLPGTFTTEAVVFSGKSGNKLVGWYLKPKAAAYGKMLLMHGNGGNVLSEYPAAAAFAKRGFSVFVFDYSGFGFSEGKATRSHVLMDAQAALDYLHNRADEPGTKLIIYGQSLGGHAALVLAEKNQDKISAVVSEGAFSSHKDIAAQRAGPLGFFARLIVAEQYSAKKSIRRLHKPVMIVHSTEDEIIPYRMGQTLFSRANEPKSFYTIAHGHIEGPGYYADSLAARILQLAGAR